jgi:hypothetical protein
MAFSRQQSPPSVQPAVQPAVQPTLLPLLQLTAKIFVKWKVKKLLQCFGIFDENRCDIEN